MSKEVVIIGYGGHSFVAIDIFLSTGYLIKGYCDSEEKSLNPFNLQYFGSEETYFLSNSGSGVNAFVTIGNSRIREKIISDLSLSNSVVLNAIHPKAIIANTVELGKGIFVAANAVINPVCKIGDGVICNTSSSIDHECIIEDFAHIGPGAVLCGNVKVGRHSFIGANSVIKPGITIGENVFIGAGSVIVKDILDGGIYYGNPATKKV